MFHKAKRQESVVDFKSDLLHQKDFRPTQRRVFINDVATKSWTPHNVRGIEERDDFNRCVLSFVMFARTRVLGYGWQVLVSWRLCCHRERAQRGFQRGAF